VVVVFCRKLIMDKKCFTVILFTRDIQLYKSKTVAIIMTTCKRRSPDFRDHIVVLAR